MSGEAEQVTALIRLAQLIFRGEVFLSPFGNGPPGPSFSLASLMSLSPTGGLS